MSTNILLDSFGIRISLDASWILFSKLAFHAQFCFRAVLDEVKQRERRWYKRPVQMYILA